MMEDAPNQSAPEATAESVRESDLQSTDLESLLDSMFQPSEQWRSELALKVPIYEQILQDMHSALRVLGRPYEQWRSILGATGLASAMSHEQMLAGIDIQVQLPELLPSALVASALDSAKVPGNVHPLLDSGVPLSGQMLSIAEATGMASAMSHESILAGLAVQGDPYEHWPPALGVTGLASAVDHRNMISMLGIQAEPIEQWPLAIGATAMASAMSQEPMFVGLGLTGPILDRITDHLRPATTPANSPQIFPPFLPTYDELEEILLVLNKWGFYFCKVLPARVVFELYRLRRAESLSDDVVATNLLLDITSTEKFARELEEDFQKLPFLRRRWPIIKETLDGHRNGSYFLSVRSLLAEIEGVIGDVLAAEGLVQIEGDKVYRVTENSRWELKGLAQIAGVAQHSRLQTSKEFKSFRKYAKKILARRRHSILHGRNPDFGTANESVKLLLIIRGLAAAIVELSDSDDDIAL